MLNGLAGIILPETATVVVLIVTAMLTLVCGLLRRGRAFLRRVPGVLFVVAGASAVWVSARPDVSTAAVVGALLAAAGALVVYMLINNAEPDDSGTSSRAARLYLLASVVIAAVILFDDLGGYFGAMQTWEGLGGFLEAFQAGQSVGHYAAQRFIWDDGLLSAGHTSLFYGAPTYALFHVLGFSPWTMRFPAVVAMLLSIVVIYALARRFFGVLVGAAAAMLLGLNACALFYGRYASSPAGTMLAVLLAVLCTWLFLDHDRSAWWKGGVCAAALYVATLQYSPGRIVVLILLGFMPLTLACQWRHLSRRRVVGFAVIVAAATGVWRFEGSFAAQHAFLFARGEQYFHFAEYPQRIQSLFGGDLLGHPIHAGLPTTADKVEVLYRTLGVTVPQYLKLMSPVTQTFPLGDGGGYGALPQVYYAPLVVFIVWGIAHSFLRWRSWPHACLLLWLVAGSVPLLLTNRVDSHRIMLFVIPVSLWAALGVWEAARLMRQARLPANVQHACAAALVLTVTYSDMQLLHRDHFPPPANGQAVVDAVMRTPGPVAVGALFDIRELAWLFLPVLERARQDPSRSFTWLRGDFLEAIEDSRGDFSEPQSRALRRMLDRTTAILAPADRFRRVVAVLQQNGVLAVEEGPENFHVWRLQVEGAGSATQPSSAPSTN